MNLNKAMVIGRITQDLELKTTNGGTQVLNFSVATNHVYKDQSGNKVETSEFHNIVTFGKQAEVVAQYFVKGQEIYCEGRLQTRSWEDQGSGKKMYRTEIILDKFEFGAKPGGAQAPAGNFNQQPQQSQQPQQAAPVKKKTEEVSYPEEDINPEDIPF